MRLRSRFCWHVRRPLDVEAMSESARPLMGVHDFSSFACADRDEGSPGAGSDARSACPARGEHVIVDDASECVSEVDGEDHCRDAGRGWAGKAVRLGDARDSRGARPEAGGKDRACLTDCAL